MLPQSRGADARHCDEMKEGGFTEWKLFDYVDKHRCRRRPCFAQLSERSFYLRRMQRSGGFFLNPTRTAAHHAEDAAKSAQNQWSTLPLCRLRFLDNLFPCPGEKPALRSGEAPNAVA